MSVSIKIKWLKKLNAQKVSERVINDRVKLFAHSELYRLSSKYVPWRVGMLTQNVEITPKHIRYIQPYASRMYYGIGFKFRKDKHPLATAMWDKVAMQTQRGKLIRAIAAEIRRQFK